MDDVTISLKGLVKISLNEKIIFSNYVFISHFYKDYLTLYLDYIAENNDKLARNIYYELIQQYEAYFGEVSYYINPNIHNIHIAIDTLVRMCYEELLILSKTKYTKDFYEYYLVKYIIYLNNNFNGELWNSFIETNFINDEHIDVDKINSYIGNMDNKTRNDVYLILKIKDNA